MFNRSFFSIKLTEVYGLSYCEMLYLLGLFIGYFIIVVYFLTVTRPL